jgi:cytoskeletal protein CcmA (bactofilin family)
MNRSNDPRDQHPAPALRQSPDQAPRLRATPPAMPRRVVDMAQGGPMRRPGAIEPAGRMNQQEGRRMVVAKEITLSGQISKCDHLVVEGVVEGMRYDGQSLQVVESGIFNGTIEVENADIAGSYDGTMTVRGHLTVRSTGRVTGTIRYGEIEVVTGGQVNGELQSIVAASARSGYRGGSSVESILSELEQEGGNVTQHRAAGE